MKQDRGLAKPLLLLVTPLIASSSVLAALPSYAASLALSEGAVEFTRFSQNPSEVVSDADIDTFEIARDGKVDAVAAADAVFVAASPTASNFSLSRVLGEGTDYLGLAQSTAQVIGNFAVDAGTSFSFDFTANLNLAASIDYPLLESASASGDISLALLDTDTQSIIDFFSLQGNLSFQDNNDFVALDTSENIVLSQPVTTYRFGGNEEFATVSVQGSLQRSFANNTNLTLVEVKRNQARVQAPEPSTTLALLFLYGTFGVALKGKRNTMNPVS
ncbi:hypothetical protein [Scytonema sp. NUACC26]|uniref:hypothetical protein n=1 Tax=Scytonema sp. NUACC26 TaxID=3140176 RepID=UPI0034DC2BC1